VPSQKPPPSAERKRFGRNVARLRVKARLTQEALAERAGLSARYVQGIEAGDNWLSLPKLSRLRQALGCKWDVLLEGI
jgi:transcriptional regulator with XRE-family HTH domain